jgi:hypothetical protein
MTTTPRLWKRQYKLYYLLLTWLDAECSELVFPKYRVILHARAFAIHNSLHACMHRRSKISSYKKGFFAMLAMFHYYWGSLR